MPLMRTYKEPPKDVYCPDMNAGRRFFLKPMSKTCPKCPMRTAIHGKASTGHEVLDLGWVCSKQAQFQGQLEISHAIERREAAVEQERNMLVHAFNQQAVVQDAMVQKLGNLAEATRQVAIAMDEQIPLLAAPQPKMIGNSHG